MRGCPPNLNYTSERKFVLRIFLFCMLPQRCEYMNPRKTPHLSLNKYLIDDFCRFATGETSWKICGSIPGDHEDGCSSPGRPFCTQPPRGQPLVGPGWSSACPRRRLGELWRMRGGLPLPCRTPGHQCWDVAVASGRGWPFGALSSSPSTQPCCSPVECM